MMVNSIYFETSNLNGTVVELYYIADVFCKFFDAIMEKTC